MKKLIIAAVASAFVVTPAFAAKITVSFADDSGATRVVTFDDVEMTATEGENVSPYTFDQDAGELCATVDGGDICVTFTELKAKPSVGDTTGFTVNDGSSGTATITAIE